MSYRESEVYQALERIIENAGVTIQYSAVHEDPIDGEIWARSDIESRSILMPAPSAAVFSVSDGREIYPLTFTDVSVTLSECPCPSVTFMSTKDLLNNTLFMHSPHSRFLEYMSSIDFDILFMDICAVSGRLFV